MVERVVHGLPQTQQMLGQDHALDFVRATPDRQLALIQVGPQNAHGGCVERGICPVGEARSLVEIDTQTRQP